MGWFLALFILGGIIYMLSRLSAANEKQEAEEIEKMAEKKYQYLLSQKRQGVDIEEAIDKELKLHRSNISFLQELNNEVYSNDMSHSDKMYHQKNRRELKEMSKELSALNIVYKKINNL